MKEKNKMFNIKKSLIYFVCFSLLGIVAAMQLKSVLLENKQKISLSQEISKLNSQLNNQKAENKNLQIKIDKLELKKNELIKNNKSNFREGRTNDLLKEREKLRVIDGLTDVKGQGITMLLNDGLHTSEVEDINDIIIHDKDLLKIINELHKAGAQAISINDERIVAATRVFCAGPAIKINNNRCAVPYIIKAIGDPGMLYESVSNSSIIRELLLFKVQVDIKVSKDLVIKKYVSLNTIDSPFIEERNNK